MISRVILMGLIFISMDSWYFALYISEETGWHIINVREIFHDENGWLSKHLLSAVYAWPCLFIQMYWMVSLSESFRRLCYIGSYTRQTETIGWGPQKKSGVDCTNEWYLGGVFVYIGSYSSLCLQKLYQISANHRVNLIWLHRY